MNITTLITTLRTAIHNNSAAQTWCTTNYTRNHYVYVGTDVRNPPDADHYPLVHLFPVSKANGYERDSQDHVLGITCGIYDSTFLTIAGEAKSIEYNGIVNIEAFRKLIETAIVAAVPAGIRIDEMKIEYETIEFFPYFLANMEIRFCAEYYQGSDVFA